MGTRTRHLVLALLMALPGLAGAATPAGYFFSGVPDVLPDNPATTDDFKDRFDDRRVASMATAVEDLGFVYGFWLDEPGSFHAWTLRFSGNPLSYTRRLDDFINLSGSNVRYDFACLFGFCNDYGFGIRITPPVAPATTPTGTTAFMNTPAGTAAITDSLPYARYPGNFVEENGVGVLATTQVSATAQFGVLVRDNTQVKLEDVPWLIGINDLANPLVIAYDGRDMACLLTGDCTSDPGDDCEHDDDDDHHGHGIGHEEHGEGYGWGHDKCTHDSTSGSSIAAALGIVPRTVAVPTGGALLLRLAADNSVTRYRFPTRVTSARAGMLPLSSLYPLAINNDRVILRGDVTNGSQVLDKRLLSCRFSDASLDADADGVVDCIDGLQLLGDTGASVRVGTLLGFTLSNAGVLAGNLGYSAAERGWPFVLDVTEAVPNVQSVISLAGGSADWEISTLTDMNQKGMLVGYGYRDCSYRADAFFIKPQDSAPAATFAFGRGAFESPAVLVSGNKLALSPTITGGSGLFEYRIHTRKPGEAAWTQFTNWTSKPGKYNPGSYLGDVCFRIEVRDALTPETTMSEIVRYRVVDQQTAATEGLLAPTSVATVPLDGESVDVGTLLAAPALPSLVVLLLSAWRRRRRAVPLR